ncbi:biotin--[acetyl-CoA-carboxylase] ligase [Ligilactobacillus ceti]|uniref:Bifunctional ligase/repressor BirA n=1 Tax=Ligilactobacillus ceti DSM 22408 TaxID=1122146 RepID=A0A0R2KJ83_9LACO|nr:biotin--[acetyl-CoA-carboxylase] ligase [Ligilactobacillus ceti]KRN89417.1 biotin operon repressor biotin--[acetyl-CoA-carboxylase] synthetase [Ligilactobacillus ceti DSM 22408]
METTEKVLHLLSTSSKEYLSGETLARELGMSRTAIWKAIKSLQQQGHNIVSKPRLGYHYIDNQALNEYIIHNFLNKDLTLQFEVHEKLKSTNLRAKEIAFEPINQPYIILSDYQTNGYGRRGRHFSSPAQTGIYLSILLNTQNTTLNPGLLTTATALAVTRTIEKELGETPQIKWVNDVLLNNKKIAGILTEAVMDFENQQIKNVIIGVGINYLSDYIDFPDELQDIVGTLKDAALKANISRNQFIASFLNEFFALYQNYQAANFMPEYREHSAVIGKEVTITQGKETFNQVVTNIDDQGCLILQDGTRLNSGEVTKIRTV